MHKKMNYFKFYDSILIYQKTKCKPKTGWYYILNKRVILSFILRFIKYDHWKSSNKFLIHLMKRKLVD